LPTIICNIVDTELGRRYYQLVKQNYDQQAPIFRDRPRYTVDYMLELAQKAKDQIGWNWQFDHYDIETTALLHKDIETILSNGFDQIPAELDYLLHELHYCLHIIQPKTQGPESGNLRDAWLQIEWYNDSTFDLDTTDIFQHNMMFGDIKLQNPYVGHGPLQIYLEKDFSNISQTCRFHDVVKPGINIAIIDFPYQVEVDKILDRFEKHDPEFVLTHGRKKIASYIGYPVIGRVKNIKDLKLVAEAPLLELDRIEFE
jgi:hypothetical protein